MSKWDTYYKVHASRKPREQTVRAAHMCRQKEHALDLGAGTLVESAFLLEHGFKKVTAVDSSKETSDFADKLDPERFSLKTCTYQDFTFNPNTYDLVNAQYALPFNGPRDFKTFIRNVKASLKPKGVFVGQFFGVRDDWNTKDTMLAFQTKDATLELLEGLEVVEFDEEEKEAKTASGEMKRWHVFHFIARK